MQRPTKGPNNCLFTLSFSTNFQFLRSARQISVRVPLFLHFTILESFSSQFSITAFSTCVFFTVLQWKRLMTLSTKTEASSSQRRIRIHHWGDFQRYYLGKIKMYFAAAFFFFFILTLVFVSPVIQWKRLTPLSIKTKGLQRMQMRYWGEFQCVIA